MFKFAENILNMKKLLLLVSSIAILSVNAKAQNCCAKPGSMQALAMNVDFKGAHEAPIPFTYESENGSMVSFSTTDGKTSNAFFLPSKHPTNKVVLVFHEWWGLNDYIKREAEHIQQSLGGDVDVYAVDLYDGKVATTADEAGKLMGSLDAKRGAAIVEGIIKRAGPSKKIATIGWCMGGSWSFNASVMAGTEAAGCVMYYGFPESDIKKIKPLKADVLYIRGTEDKFIQKEGVDAFGKNVKAVGRNYTQKDFPAEHAFANPSNPKYDVKSATIAMDITIKFLKEKLGIK